MKIVGYFLMIIILNACVIEPDDYDSSLDNGTYTGSVTVYDGPGTDPSFIDRTCPNVNVTLTINEGSGSISLVDTYPNHTHDDAVIVNHTANLSFYDNNKFSAEVGWAIEESDTQLSDLQSLGVCEASIGDRGLLQDFAMRIDDVTGFPGEFGNGSARGTMIYGVRCTDGTYLPVCVYFLQLTQN